MRPSLPLRFCLPVAVWWLLVPLSDAMAAPLQIPDTLAQRTLACTGCHGPQGRSLPSGYVPRIAGKPAGYLTAQLQAFRDGRRRHEAMAHLLAGLDDAYLAEIATPGRKGFYTSWQSGSQQVAVVFAALLGVMILVFGSIPFTDAMIVRYVDDRLRSRVAGMRLTVAFGISSLAVWALGPLVKGIGFSALLWSMAGIAALKAVIVLWLPDEPSQS